MGHQEVDMEGLLDWVRYYAGHFLPPDQETDEVSERHVRHYITLEVLDRPNKEGRENRYSFRHVLQMLVALKARMLTGISVKALKGRLTRLTNDELLALLSQGMEVSFVPSSAHAPSKPAKGNAEALRRIAQIRQGSEGTPRRPSSSSPWSEPPATAPQVWWRHYPVLDTLELHLRDDFRFPVSTAEEAHLVKSILENLRRHSHKPR